MNSSKNTNFTYCSSSSGSSNYDNQKIKEKPQKKIKITQDDTFGNVKVNDDMNYEYNSCIIKRGHESHLTGPINNPFPFNVIEGNEEEIKRAFSTIEQNKKREIEQSLNQFLNEGKEIKRKNILEADIIGYKSKGEKDVKYDQYGNIRDINKKDSINGDDLIGNRLKRANCLNYDENKKESDISFHRLPIEEQNKIADQQNKRILKWTEMLQNFDYYIHEKYEKIRSRTRKGIPDSMRAVVWIKLARVKELKNGKEDLYKKLLENMENLTNEDFSNKKEEDVIIRDLHRTFPKNVIFKDKLGEGQRALYKVLFAYSTYNKKTGYVQGMGFPVALFLTYMSEEDSFWMLDSLMTIYGLEPCYMNGFPGLQKYFYIFLNLLYKFLPKIYYHFYRLGITPTMYAYNWFFVCFCNTFNFQILTRIFDCLFLEGYKVIYRISLAILKIKEDDILRYKTFDDTLTVFKDLTKGIDIDTLFDVAFDFSFSRNELYEYDVEYDQKILEKEKYIEKDQFLKQACF